MSRLSLEYLNQVSYFANPNTKQEAIKKWWKVSTIHFDDPAKLDEIKYTGFKKRPDTHSKPRKLPEGGGLFNR